MKIALLLYGYLRQYKLCFHNILEQLDMNEDDIDVFIYTSKKNHLKLLNYRPIKWENIEENNEENLKLFFGDKLKKFKFKEDDDMYNKITFEKFNSLKNYFLNFVESNNEFLSEIKNHNVKRIKDYININNFNTSNHFKTKTWILRQTDQFINLFLCSNLFQTYIKKNKVEYDFVIQMRPDVIFPQKIDIKSLGDKIRDNKLIAIPGIDYFYISNQEINKKLSYFYKYFGTIHKEGLKHKTFFSPEAQSSYFLKNNFDLINFRLRTNYLRNFRNVNLKKEIYEKYEDSVKKLYDKEFLNLQQPILHR